MGCLRVWASGGGERKRVALQGRETSSFPASACPGEDVHCFVLFF